MQANALVQLQGARGLSPEATVATR